MEFNEKLQKLRKQKGLTQEELAEALFVSRTAVSKWESGRGYPNIDSLKQIAEVFSVSVDELVSANELIELAEHNERQGKKHFCDLVYGISDIFALLFLFLPLFAEKGGEIIRSVSILELSSIAPYLKAIYIFFVIALAALGVATLALQNSEMPLWLKSKRIISLSLGAASLLVFILTLNPYAAVLAFSLLSVKAFALLRH